MRPGRSRRVRRSTPARFSGTRSDAPWRWRRSTKSGQHRLWERAARTGALLQAELKSMPLPKGLTGAVRGMGLMVGLELRHRDGSPATESVLRVIKGMLRAGLHPVAGRRVRGGDRVHSAADHYRRAPGRSGERARLRVGQGLTRVVPGHEHFALFDGSPSDTSSEHE